jgi:tetratricopeptide (TPR) repeat protein/CHAT domain-containing protein
MAKPERRPVPKVASAVLAASIAGVMSVVTALTAVAMAGSDPAGIRELIERGRYPEAEAEARELLNRVEAASGAGSRAAADARDLLVAALIANSRGTEPATLELARQAVELRLDVDDAGTLATTDALLNLGTVLKECGKFAEAEEVLERALAIRDRSLGPDHLEIARVLNELGFVANRARDADLAGQRYRRALAMLERTVGSEHPECAVSLTGLFAADYLRRQFGEAEGYQLRSVELRRRALGPDHPLTAESLRGLGVLWRAMGRDDQAESTLRQAADSFERSLGPAHRQTGLALNSLALLLRDRGGLSEARALFERALEAFDSSLDPLDPWIAGVLNNLASVYRELGDFAEAEACLRRSLAIREQRYGSDHPAVAQSLGNLGAVLIEAERPSEAIPVLERALPIKERASGRSSVDFATTFANFGRALHQTGDLDHAERCLAEVVVILDGELGPGHPTVADQLNNLALVQHELGKLGAAGAGIRRAIEIRTAADGAEHPRVGRYLYNLARVEADTGNGAAAITVARRAEALGREHLELTARGLAEAEAIRFDTYIRNRLDLLLGFSLRWPESARDAWDALIRLRGLVLDELIARRRVAASDDTDVASIFAELASSTERLANLTLRGDSGGSPERRRAELDATRNEVDRLERQLGEVSVAFREGRRRFRIGLDEVTTALPPGTALVGLIRRWVFTEPLGTSTPATSGYLALVLAPGSKQPAPVDLGPSPEIESLVEAWRRAAVAPGVEEATDLADETAYRRAGRALRRRVWDPLVPHLGAATAVFVVPDGELSLVNLAALPDDGSGYLIETGPLIHMLDEERDLVVGTKIELGESAVLLALGDPDFDWRPGSRGASMRSAAGGSLRGPPAPCGDLGDVVFRPLPSTSAEVSTIAALWREQNQTAIQLTGAEATESELKRRAPGAAVVHLATHGFVLGERCREGVAAGRGIGGLALSRSQPPVAASPSLDLLGVSGLALAGANHRAQAGADGEDGVITAMEIANLDLSTTRWAVLSACDTGVGESVSGEGVFGFRRAFRIAGAQTVVMSLWPVHNEATRDWMEHLYRARLEDGLSTAESVRRAGLKLLRERRESGQSTHPFTWGAFIAAGDWR